MKKILSVLVVLATLVVGCFANDRFVILDYETEESCGVAYDRIYKKEMSYGSRLTIPNLKSPEDSIVLYLDSDVTGKKITGLTISKDVNKMGGDDVEVFDFMLKNNIVYIEYNISTYDVCFYIFDDIFVSFVAEEEE